MIALTRIAGQPFVLNCDLIERVDCTPDTVITLVDGKKYVVLETLDDVVTAVRAYRSEIIALSTQLDAADLTPDAPQLSSVTPISYRES